MRCFMLVALPSIFLLEYQDELKHLTSILRGSYRLFFSLMWVEDTWKIQEKVLILCLPSINYWEMLCPRFKYHDGQEALKSDITTTNERRKIIYRTKIAYLFDIIERCVYHITHPYTVLPKRKTRLRIKVFNYRQKLRDKFSSKKRQQKSGKEISHLTLFVSRENQ